MIYDGVIHVLDIDAQEHYNLPIEDIFKKYIHLSTIDDNSIETIDLSGRNIKIADGTGWTQLLKITRDEMDAMMYSIGSTISDIHINASESTLIPIYKPYMSKPGFHGEVLYQYTPKALCDCQYGIDNIRVFDFNNTKYDRFEPIHHHMMEDVYIKGYNIFTKSGFYNCSNMHLCTSVTWNRDGKEQWK